jgi:glutamate carboxypeptidase
MKHTHLLACISSALFIMMTAPVFSAAQTLSSAEKKIVKAADAQEAPALELLEKLVNINSGTMNLEGVEKVSVVMRGELEKLGFKVRWIPMAEVGRAGHIVAEHKGSGRGARMLLIGHLDTVFEKESAFQKFVKRGDVAEGPGVTDMKGGLAIMIAALNAMKSAGTLAPANITIVLTGDEERAGRPLAVSRKDLVDAASRSDVALEFEGLAQEDGHDMGSIARRSSSNWLVTATATSGHSSGIFSDRAGYGAIYEITRIADTFRRELQEPNATFNVGLILGGATAEVNATNTGGAATGKDNVIPAKAMARGDLRTLSNDQTARIREKMRAIVSQPLKGVQAQISFEDGYPAMPPTERSRALLERLNGINAALGLETMGELDPLKRGAGDISFVADKVDGLIGFGAAGDGEHAPGETIDLNCLDRQIKRAALMMTRLSQTPYPRR